MYFIVPVVYIYSLNLEINIFASLRRANTTNITNVTKNRKFQKYTSDM